MHFSTSQKEAKDSPDQLRNILLKTWTSSSYARKALWFDSVNSYRVRIQIKPVSVKQYTSTLCWEAWNALK